MILENCRHNFLGRRALQCILSNTSQSIIPDEEEAFISKAIQLTLDSLTCLETSDTHLNPGDSSLTAVSLWFLSIESYFAKIIKIICLYTGQDFKDYKKVHICKKIDLICEHTGIDKISFHKTTIRCKLQEFNEIRNSIFHAGCFQNNIKIKHTVFSSIPIFMNQSDVIQAADIAVNVMSMFRGIFKNVDIMPTYVIHFPPSQCIKFIAIDTFYSDVILKSFLEILKKHNITTSFTPIEHEHLNQNHIISTTIHPLIKAIPDDIFKMEGEAYKTNIIEQNYINLSNRECSNQEPNTIGLYKAITS